MDEVWIRFGEDSGIPERMNMESFKKLATLFDATNAHTMWHQALRVLGMDMLPPQSGIVKLSGDVPLVNWSYMTRVVSGGSVTLVATAEGGAKAVPRLNLLTLWRLFRTHWRVSQYLLPRLKIDAPLPAHDDEKIVESLALGLCLLSLTQRLKEANEVNLAAWLKTPETLSPVMRKTVEQIQAIQKRRTLLSPVWRNMFPSLPQEVTAHPAATPDQANGNTIRWKGIGVSGDAVSGKAMVFQSIGDFHAYNHSHDKIIAVFPRARPETVEVFSRVLAVLYGDGGTLSHACTVAREYNLPCITGLGQGFIADIALRQNIVLTIDPQNGVVQIMETL